MDEKCERLKEVLKKFKAGEIRRDHLMLDILGIFSPEEIVVALSDTLRLALWIKARELEFRARLKRRPIPGSPQTDNVLPYDVYSGRAQAYHDVWRQMLFPGLSVQDGTLDPDLLAAAEKRWTEKAEEVLRIKREGRRGE